MGFRVVLCVRRRGFRVCQSSGSLRGLSSNPLLVVAPTKHIAESCSCRGLGNEGFANVLLPAWEWWGLGAHATLNPKP